MTVCHRVVVINFRSPACPVSLFPLTNMGLRACRPRFESEPGHLWVGWPWVVIWFLRVSVSPSGVHCHVVAGRITCELEDTQVLVSVHLPCSVPFITGCLGYAWHPCISSVRLHTPEFSLFPHSMYLFFYLFIDFLIHLFTQSFCLFIHFLSLSLVYSKTIY